MSSSLGLSGDLDDVDLVEDIEAAFGLRFSDDEIGRCSTVGHLFELVETKLPDASVGGCATAMTFYRLRRGLQIRATADLRPMTPISALASLPVRELQKIIIECGLRPPPDRLSLWGCIALALVVVLPVGALALNPGWLLATVSAIPAIALYRVAPVRLSSDVATFGDLARAVTSHSVGALLEQGARLRSSEAWTALQDVVSDHTTLPKRAITLDTTILAPS